MHGNTEPVARLSEAEQYRLHDAALLAAANAIVVTDRTGGIIWVNPAFTTLTGYTAEEAMGHNPRLLKSGVQDPSFYREMWKTILNGQAWHGEIINRRKDGTLYVEEMTVTPVRGNDSEITHFIAIKQDVTRRKEAEEALLRQQRLLDAIFDNILAQVAFMDKDFNIVRVNASYARGSGHPVEELIGRNHFDLFPHDENKAIFERVRDTGEPYIARAKPYVFLDQPERGVNYWDWWLRPIRNPQGETEGVVLSLVDVTPTERSRQEVERLNAELVEADQRKDEFLAMLGHELRNPVAAILGAVELLLQRGPADPVVLRTREVISRQAEHMSRLLDDLLDAARVTRGKIGLQKERVNLGTIVDDAIQATGGLIESRGHQLALSLPLEPLRIDADPDRLQQIISNLLSNAAKYTEPGGEIRLSVKREADEAVLRVADTGVGIAPELLDHVFDLFVQAERTPDRLQGGLGIGLTMVRRLVEMHGGRVCARSEGPGKGSEFVVRLPLLSVLDEEEPVSAAPSADPPGHGRRVLLVEDNIDVAEMQAQLLELDGHEVVLAHDGPSALEAAVQYQPDTVLLDIGLPGMDGYEVARRLREQDAGCGALLIALTGYGQDQDRSRALAAGFDHHLTKPVEMPRLREILTGGTAQRS